MYIHEFAKISLYVPLPILGFDIKSPILLTEIISPSEISKSSFRLGNIFNTCKVSDPIPTLLPTETEPGIWDTYISVVAAPGDASDPTIGEER